jgi:hypothetical protein
MIHWNDYPGSDNLQGYASSCAYSRISSKYSNPQLFTAISSALDIEQGQDADCYWVTATSEEAETGRIPYNFLTKTYNSAGIFAVQLWVRGLPTVITVDDYIPFYGGSPLFDREAPSGAFWAVIMEKVWAKYNGNYEYINYGW